MTEWFRQFSRRAANLTGHPFAFATTVLLIVAWAMGGLFVGYGNVVYQSVLNLPLSIGSFLLLLVLQSSQNADKAVADARDAAQHRKTNELVRSVDAADDALAGIEEGIEATNGPG